MILLLAIAFFHGLWTFASIEEVKWFEVSIKPANITIMAGVSAQGLGPCKRLLDLDPVSVLGS